MFRFSPDEILDFSLYSPLKSRPRTTKGVSPMEAIAIQAELAQTATKWNWNFFKNNASVGGVLKTERSIDRETKSRAIRAWKNNYQ